MQNLEPLETVFERTSRRMADLRSGRVVPCTTVGQDGDRFWIGRTTEVRNTPEPANAENGQMD